MAYITFVEELH